MGLSSPVIVEELSVCSRQVRAQIQLTGARVDILIDGVPDPVGGGTADWPDQWFSLDPGLSLLPGQVVRLRQSRSGESSPISDIHATVQDRSAGHPQFAAPLVACSEIAVVGGLAPGATVTVTDAGGVGVGNMTAAGTRVVVPLTRAAILGEVLTATSVACGGPPSPTAHSLAAEPMKTAPGGELPVPLITGAVMACMRALHFLDLQVGASVLLERRGVVYTWPVTATEMYGRIDPPLAAGELLTIWQEAPHRCQARPSRRVARTVDVGPPGPPWITGPVCPGSRLLRIDGLVPTATVKILSGGNELHNELVALPII